MINLTLRYAIVPVFRDSRHQNNRFLPCSRNNHQPILRFAPPTFPKKLHPWLGTHHDNMLQIDIMCLNSLWILNHVGRTTSRVIFLSHLVICDYNRFLRGWIRFEGFFCRLCVHGRYTNHMCVSGHGSVAS